MATYCESMVWEWATKPLGLTYSSSISDSWRKAGLSVYVSPQLGSAPVMTSGGYINHARSCGNSAATLTCVISGRWDGLRPLCKPGLCICCRWIMIKHLIKNGVHTFCPLRFVCLDELMVDESWSKRTENQAISWVCGP